MSRFGTKSPAKGWATRRARYGPSGAPRTLPGYQSLMRLLGRLEQERDEARGVAYTLAHAYTHESRPPVLDVHLALSWKPVAGVGAPAAPEGTDGEPKA